MLNEYKESRRQSNLTCLYTFSLFYKRAWIERDFYTFL